MKNWWEQLAIYQGVAALHLIINRYGAEAFTPEELQKINDVADILAQLPLKLQKKA